MNCIHHTLYQNYAKSTNLFKPVDQIISSCTRMDTPHQSTFIAHVIINHSVHRLFRLNRAHVLRPRNLNFAHYPQQDVWGFRDYVICLDYERYANVRRHGRFEGEIQIYWHVIHLNNDIWHRDHSNQDRRLHMDPLSAGKQPGGI